MEYRVYIRTFGCQMNVRDSERMLGLLFEHGFSLADDPDSADLLLVNTCSVRDKPEQKVMGVLSRWKPIKHGKPETVIGVCGCVAQQHGEQLLEAVPWLDLVIGTQMVHCLPRLVERARAGERVAAVDWLEPGSPELFRAPDRYTGNKTSAFVSIM